ncbi:MAG: flippase-like domain-containing protein, partial [Candidatus Cloacimonetes bacterium]|nr:flippase-like domain-containing protein [Candidatus Cloacimonadota bacterium]
SNSLPSVFIDKMFDMIAIFIVLLLLPFAGFRMSPLLLNLIIVLIVLVIIALTILIVASFAPQAVISLLRKFLFFVPSRFEHRLEDIIHLFVDGLALFKHNLSGLPVIVLLTLAAIATDSLFFYFVFCSVGHPPAYMAVLLGYTLLYLSYILPHPPAQIGSNEWITTLIFVSGFGMASELVSAAVVTAHLATGVLITVIGIIALHYTGINIMWQQSETDEDITEKKEEIDE